MSEAREDLPQARAPLPPIPAPAVQQAAGQGATIYQFPSMPTAAPPATANAAPPLATSSQVIPTALQPLVSKIKGGESGNRNVLYGNDPVPPGNVIPGAIGPTGKPTHAFSEWQFEPGTWNDAAKAFRQVGWVLNKDDPSDRDRAGLWVARRDYKAKTGRDLDADAQAGKIDEGALHATWTSIRPQYAAAREERYATGSSELQGIAAETHKIMEEIGKTGRDPKMFNMLQEARQKMAEYEERALKLQEEGPKNDPRDLMQRMGGVATVIGILGGLLTKQPLMASLNAGGAAMEAYNKQDETAYRANVDQWKFHIETLQRMGQIQHDLIRDTLADEKLDSGEKMSRLQAMLSALGNERLAVSAQLGDQRALEQHRDQMAQADRQFTLQMRRLDEMENKGWQILTDPTKKDEAGNPVQYRYNPNSGEATTLDRQPYSPGGAQKVGTATQSAGTPEQVKTTAQAIANYQMAPMSGYAMRSPYGQAVMTEVFKLNPQYQATQYSGQQAAASATGRRASTLTIASNAADQMIPIVEDLSHKVSRTDYPTINRILLVGREKTGDPDVVAFGQALNSLLYVYMRALNPSGIPRVADLERGEHMLQTAWSQGQLDSVIAQMKREIGAEKAAVQLSAHEMSSLFSGEDPLKIKPDQMGATQGTSDTIIKYDAQGNRVQ
jgi:hypothetical protein